MNGLAFIREELERRRSGNRFRSLQVLMPGEDAEVTRDGRSLVNFCSNDYLGLTRHPLLRERAAEFMNRYGSGSGSSRLICGTLPCVETVEEKLARLKGTEAALIFNSGFQANLSLLPAMADRDSLVLSDRLNHRSIIEGTRLCRCDIAIFDHGDLDHLGFLLEERHGKGYSRIFIVTESVFSMDGDRSDLAKLAVMTHSSGAVLIVDEAHATGVLGERGMGLAVGNNVDCIVGTFGKALGSFGAYGAFSCEMKEYLVNCCSGLIYSTALPPSVLGAIDAALDLVPTMDGERNRLMEMAEVLRRELRARGWDTGASTTHIIPIIVGGEAETLELAEWLEKSGILALAIRPPTVERGRSRIRLSLSALHRYEHVNRLLDALDRWNKDRRQ